MSSIDELKAAAVSGFARSNRYRVFFPDGDGELNVLCDSIVWPGRQIFTNERFVDMKATKVAYAFGQEDIEISFLMRNDWYTWDYLNDWMGRVIGNIGGLEGYTVNYKSDYARNNIRIQHLSTENDVTKEVVLKNVYPTSLNTIELSNESENEIVRVSSEFSYDNWEIVS
jgi:hypothetical protein